MEKGPIVNKFIGASTFDQMGKIILVDLEQGIKIHAGQIFEAKTQKGGTNLIVAMRVLNSHMYYMHGDRCKKVHAEEFARAVLHGELQPRTAKEIDTERLSKASIGLDAIANRRTGEEQIEYMGEHAAERYYRDAGKGGAAPLIDPNF